MADDAHLDETASERLDHVTQQVVGQRARRDDPLLGVRDRGRLGRRRPRSAGNGPRLARAAGRWAGSRASRPGLRRRRARAHRHRTPVPDRRDGPRGRPISILRGHGARALQGARHEGRVQAHAQRRHLASRLVGAPRGLGPALPPQRRHDLLDQAGLAVGRGPEGAQVPRLDAVRAPARQRRAAPPAPPRRSARGAPGAADRRTRARRGARSAPRVPSSAAGQPPARRRWAARRAGMSGTSRGTRGAPGSGGGSRPRVQRVEVLPDDAQRQVVVPLHAQHVPQPLDVCMGELAVPGRGALRGRPDPAPPGSGSWRW